MDAGGEFRPNDFVVFTSVKGTHSHNSSLYTAPLTLGDEMSCTALYGINVAASMDGNVYTFPTGCSTKNYKRPCGMGATLVCNNVVLMYPDVRQYSVPDVLRAPKQNETGFLLCCSSPSSASSKGLIRYVATAVVIRCYKQGVRDHMIAMARYLDTAGCQCQDSYFRVHIAGCDIEICSDCMDART